eukprot:scaffold55981_cov21-Tisochrysis_lutea.AAC.1
MVVGWVSLFGGRVCTGEAVWKRGGRLQPLRVVHLMLWLSFIDMEQGTDSANKPPKTPPAHLCSLGCGQPQDLHLPFPCELGSDYLHADVLACAGLCVLPPKHSRQCLAKRMPNFVTLTVCPGTDPLSCIASGSFLRAWQN